MFLFFLLTHSNCEIFIHREKLKTQLHSGRHCVCLNVFVMFLWLVHRKYVRVCVSITMILLCLFLLFCTHHTIVWYWFCVHLQFLRRQNAKRIFVLYRRCTIMDVTHIWRSRLCEPPVDVFFFFWNFMWSVCRRWWWNLRTIKNSFLFLILGN